MIDSLPQFIIAPTLCQFARDGVWEEAWTFHAGARPSRSDLSAYLAGRTEIAFEAFFGRPFFGARFAGTPIEIEAFAATCLKAVGAQRSFFDVLRRELGLPSPDQPPAFAEIGCVNAWRGAGVMRLSNLERAASDFETVWQAASGSPVGRDNRHVKAIEFAFERPLPHWFGLPVSGPGESKHLSRALLREALRRVAHRTKDAP